MPGRRPKPTALKIAEGNRGKRPLNLNEPQFGGFADGGDPLVGRFNLVGERGPELFVPRTAGTIVPHDKLFGDSHSWYIDARGNNDPAATIQAFDRYMRGAAPQIAAAGAKARDEHNLRRPPSARR